MMARHAMVDLESLGLDEDCLILSIGVVVFSKDSGIEQEGHWPLRLDQPGRTVDVNTVAWWMQQEDAARAVFAADKANQYALRAALEDVSKAFDRDTLIWSNGANFDEPILKHAFKQHGLKVPWGYKNVRCFRTIRAQYPDIIVPSDGVKHNALDDARWQANVMLEIMRQKDIDFQ